MDFLVFESQLHSGPPAKYSQNLSWGSLGSPDPIWQEAEDLISTRARPPSSTLGSSWTVNQPKSLLAEKAHQNTTGTVSFPTEHFGADGLTYSTEKFIMSENFLTILIPSQHSELHKYCFK